MSADNLQDILEKIGIETDGFNDGTIPFVWPEAVPQDQDIVTMGNTYVIYGFRGFPEDIHGFNKRIAATNIFDIQLTFMNKNFRSLLTQSKIFTDKFVNAARALLGTSLYRTSPSEDFKCYVLTLIIRVEI